MPGTSATRGRWDRHFNRSGSTLRGGEGAITDRAITDRAITDRAITDRAITDRAITDRARTD
jgi:hypothetical protein